MGTIRTVGCLMLVLVATVSWLPQSAVAAPAPGPSQIEGVIATSDATSLTVALKNNDRVHVTPTADTRIILRTNQQLQDIKANDLVAVTAKREPDGSLTALLINIIPPEFKGQFTLRQSLMESGNIMTNAIVFQNVRRIDGRTLYLKMPDGTAIINVPQYTDIFRLSVVRLVDLKPGMRVVVRGTNNPDGSLVAIQITADVPPR